MTTPTNPIDLQRAMKDIAKISAEAQQMTADLSQKMNAAMILKAMQTGYSMACADNQIPSPDFPDARIFFGV